MQRFIILLSVVTLLFIGGFGMNLSMSIQNDGKMSKCPLMVQSSSFCQMGIVEHISKWQEMFLAIPFSGALFLLFGLVFAVWHLSQRNYFSLSPPISLRLYKREHPDIKLFDNLLLAFSKGILHPKIYA